VKRSRSVGIGEAKPEDVAKYVEGYRVWRRSFENPTEHRAYIKSICRQIVEQFSPEKIILFGSHASGRTGPDSDLDLLVVMHFEGGYFHQASEIRRRLRLPIPLDLLVRTPEQVQKRLGIGDRFMREIIERGEVIYEADHR
jgi:predicted nucleotidyltransferase